MVVLPHQIGINYLFDAYNILERTPVSFGPGVFLFLGGTMEEKVFKTLDEFVELLIQRGVAISDASDRAYAKRVLEKKWVL